MFLAQNSSPSCITSGKRLLANADISNDKSTLMHTNREIHYYLSVLIQEKFISYYSSP